MSDEAYGRYRYFLTFTDDLSRYLYIYLMKYKACWSSWSLPCSSKNTSRKSASSDHGFQSLRGWLQSAHLLWPKNQALVRPASTPIAGYIFCSLPGRSLTFWLWGKALGCSEGFPCLCGGLACEGGYGSKGQFFLRGGASGFSADHHHPSFPAYAP